MKKVNFLVILITFISISCKSTQSNAVAQGSFKKEKNIRNSAKGKLLGAEKNLNCYYRN